MSFARRQIFTILARPTSTIFRRGIQNMANKASLKPAEDFIEFVNASPTRMLVRTVNINL